MKESLLFKIVYYLFLSFFIVFEVVLIFYCVKTIINILTLLLCSAAFLLILMFSYGLFIIADKVEEMENNIKSNILKTKANIKKDK